MKAIILVSSIFYILGLKISHKIDLIKPHHSGVEKVIVHEAAASKTDKSIELKDVPTIKSDQDSLAGGGITDKILENK